MQIDPARIEELFVEALARPDTAARVAYLDQACAEQAELRQRVEALLAAHDATSNFLKLPTNGSGSSAPLREGPGSRIDRYKLLEQIGEGGFGVVFMAEQEEPVHRRVALKIIKLGMDTRQVVARFEAERQALALMDHPNIAKVLDAGATDTGRPYFVMELVKGIPIVEYCDQQRLSPRQRLELFIHVCQAVQHAHQKGIIHRDLKPTNVLVAEYDGKPIPKIIDFGVAKAIGQRLTERTMFTEFGQVIGTIEYMSPEQARFNQLDIDTRSDIYSLGVLLYELLSGSTPLNKQQLHSAAFDEMLRLIREEEPVPPQTRLNSSQSLASIAAQRALDPKALGGVVRGELDWIVMKCLAKDRNARYASATDLAGDLEHWLHDEPLSIRAPNLEYLLRLWIKRNLGSTGWAIALGIIWGLLGGLICWLVMLNPFELSLPLRRVIYILSVGLMIATGFVNVWLIRPKNAAADFISGALTGIVAAVLSQTISWAWISVIIVGAPVGIWLSMISALIYVGAICLLGTMAAGRLLRIHGQMRAAIWPYAELATPSVFALVYANALGFNLAVTLLAEIKSFAPKLAESLAFNVATPRLADWQYFLAPAILCSIAALAVFRRWPWPLRILLHVAWIGSIYMFVTRHVGR